MKALHTARPGFFVTLFFVKLIGISALTLLSTSASAENLLEVYEQALSNDHEYKAAEAAYGAGRQAKGIGRSGLLPKLNGEASWSDASSDTNGNTYNTTTSALEAFDQSSDTTSTGYKVTLAQPLFNLQAWHEFKRGAANAQLAEAQFNGAQQAVVIRAAETYFDALKAVDSLETAKAEEKAFSHQLEQSKQRYEVGLTAITEVHEAQAAYDSALANRLIAEGQMGIAFEALEVITGAPVTTLRPLRDDFPVLPPEPLARNEWVELALERNPNLIISLAAEKAARQNAKAKTAAHLPTITGSYTHANTDSDTSTGIIPDENRDSTSNTVALTLSVPLYNGGFNSASRKQAKFQHLEAKENYKKSQRDTIQATRSQHLRVVTAVATVKARAQAIVSNRSALEATQAGYEVGTRDLVDVLNAQRNLNRAQLDYYDALYSYILNSLRLKEVAGVLEGKDIAALSEWLDASKTVSR